MDFLHFDLGNLINIVTIIGTALAFITTLGSRLNAVERELSELRRVVVDIARQEERMNAIDQRLIMTGQRLDTCLNKVDRIIEKE